MRKILGNIVRFMFRLSTLGWKKRYPLTRYLGYRKISEYKNYHHSYRVLDIGNSSNLARIIGCNGIESITYPEHDILALPFDDGTYDAVVSDQVLEHVKGDPFEAVRESFRVVRTGGIVVHTSTFFNRKHSEYDYWRFSPYGLKLMADRYGRTIDYGGHGNPILYLLMIMGLNSELIPECRLHPLNWIANWNDGETLVFTWIIAQK